MERGRFHWSVNAIYNILDNFFHSPIDDVFALCYTPFTPARHIKSSFEKLVTFFFFFFFLYHKSLALIGFMEAKLDLPLA